MAADCHAKTHVDGGPPRPKREEGDHQESPDSTPKKQVIIEGVTYIAVDAVDQIVNLGHCEAYCDMCGLEPEQDLWKGGNDIASKSTKLKSQYSAAPVPKMFTPAPRTMSTAANPVGTKAVQFAQVSIPATVPETAIPKMTTAKSALSFRLSHNSQLSIASLPPCMPTYPTDSQDSIHLSTPDEEQFFEEDGVCDRDEQSLHRAIQNRYPDAPPHLVSLCVISVDTSLRAKINFRNPTRATRICADGYVLWAD